jgi:hypothetical protein
MTDPSPKRTRAMLSQALRSVQHLESQRNLHQIALCQWIAGRFTLADWFPDPTPAEISQALKGGAVEIARHELWLWIHDGGATDIAIEIVRGPAGLVMAAHWADDVISAGARSKTNNTAVRFAEVILKYRDRLDGRDDVQPGD